MTSTRVDTEQLLAAAGRIRRAADEARAATCDPRPLRAAVAALGAAGLVAAAGEFVTRWSHALDEVVDDARRTADALELLSRVYAEADAAVRDLADPLGPR